MAILASIRNLIIPHKVDGKPADAVPFGTYGDDMRYLETWARQPIQQLVAGSGITLSPATGLATDANGNGPNPITISASGGSGITDLISDSFPTITITNPTGPTTTVVVTGFPFLQYSDSSRNTGYGHLVAPAAGGATDNTAIGYEALQSTSSGSSNTAVGSLALSSLTVGAQNTAVGLAALEHATNVFAQNNTAVGVFALQTLTTGSTCTAMGVSALAAVTTGTDNTAVGYTAGSGITTGIQNTHVGSGAHGSSASYQTTLGAGCTTGALGCVAIGVDSTGTGASTSTQNVIALGTANHHVQISANTTGAGSAALGTNSPATTNTAPYTWFRMVAGDGSTVYVPAWK